MFFYIPDLKSGSISGEDSAHFFSMRVKAGDQFRVTDLVGNTATIKINSLDKKTSSVEFEVLHFEKNEKSSEILLFQSLLDKPYLEKLVEIIPQAGISKLFLFQTERSVKTVVNLNRLNKILIRSCEQSETVWKPEIRLLEKSKALTLIEKYKPAILEFNGLGQFGKKINSVMVGPEGGFTENELIEFKKLGLASYSLGKTVFPAWLAGYTFLIKAN